jgi:hypothetical protein
MEHLEQALETRDEDNEDGEDGEEEQGDGWMQSATPEGRI